MSPSGNLEEEDILSPSAAVVDSEFGRDNSEDNAVSDMISIAFVLPAVS